MNEVFATEWHMRREGARHPQVVGEAPRRGAAFDPDVKIGDIRIFADLSSPFVALIVEDRGLSGYRAVPVSPFSAPASRRERVVGPRVLQLWNTCTISRRIAERSWLVDTIGGETLSDLVAAIPAAFPGRVTSGDGIVAKYEREFLVSGANFALFPPKSRARRGILPVTMAIFRAAASLAICIGVFYAIIGPGKESLRVWRESASIVNAAPEDQAVELLDVAKEESSEFDFGENVEIDFLGSPTTVAGTVPAPRFVDIPIHQLRKVVELPPGAIRIRQAEGLVDPCVMPLSAFEYKTTVAMMSATGGGRGVPRTEAGEPELDCRIATAPWNAGCRVLAIGVKAGPSARIEVFFDKEMVGGFRLLDAPSLGGVAYEIVPRGDGRLKGDFVQVTACWKSGGAVRRRTVALREVESSEFESIGDRRGVSTEGADKSEDVSVEVRF